MEEKTELFETMPIRRAALSTCLSNTVSLIFLLIHVIRSREVSLVKIPLLPQHTEHSRHMEIYAIGTPAALQILLAAVSNAVLLRLMSAYPVAAISGMGVMQKVESIPFQAIIAAVLYKKLQNSLEMTKLSVPANSK